MKKSTHSPEYLALRAELVRLRETAQLSQRDLAAKLDVPHSWVAKIETGERRIDVVELAWVLAACGVDAASTTSTIVSRIIRGQVHKGRRL